MLLLWDHVIERHTEALSRLDRAQLCGLALDVIESTERLFYPPFAEFFTSDAASLISSTIEHVKNSAPDWRLGSEFVAGFHGRLDSLPQVATRPGTGPFMMAAMRLIDGIAGAMDVDETLEIMSACYEAILMSQLAGRVTMQMQEENGRCRAAIDVQEQLISRYLSI